MDTALKMIPARTFSEIVRRRIEQNNIVRFLSNIDLKDKNSDTCEQISIIFGCVIYACSRSLFANPKFYTKTKAYHLNHLFKNSSFNKHAVKWWLFCLFPVSYCLYQWTGQTEYTENIDGNVITTRICDAATP